MKRRCRANIEKLHPLFRFARAVDPWPRYGVLRHFHPHSYPELLAFPIQQGESSNAVEPYDNRHLTVSKHATCRRIIHSLPSLLGCPADMPLFIKERRRGRPTLVPCQVAIFSGRASSRNNDRTVLVN